LTAGEGWETILYGRVICLFSFVPEERREELKTTFPFFFEPEAARGGVRLVCLTWMETGRTMISETERGDAMESAEE
jgi:hypothetical protein